MNLRNSFLSAFLLVLTVVCSGSPCLAQHYPIVDTGQQRCYDNSREVTYPKPGGPFFGQDAQYQGNQPSYRDNGDGTITDLVTGLTWQKDPGPKKTFEEAVAGGSACKVGGHDDWRLPSIKELYSLILFSGEDVDPQSTDTSDLKPFIDTDYFGFVYGDPAKGERLIDSQMATSTKYVSTTMRGSETMFGVNFADGRIKGYPAGSGRPGRPSKGYYVFYVRGNTKYGENDFHDNHDGTITDRATGLTWAKLDSGHLKAGENQDGKLNWEQALRWVEDLEYAGYSDWRLPNIKELQSIVDYTRSPDTTRSAAIDPVFSATPIRDALGEVNYPFYWSSTTHKRMGGGAAAAYVAFGRSQGWMSNFGGQYNLLDVHGAGSQRSDPKAGDPSQFPRGRGPQGDVIDIYNMVRPVRGGEASFRQSGPELEPQPSGRRRRGPDQGGPMGPDQRGPGRMGPGRQGPGGMGPGGPMGGNRPGFVRRLDRDGDGKVSRQEFDGPADAFDHLDANQDGYLNDSEGPAQQGMGPQRGPRPGNRRGPGAAATRRPSQQPKPTARPKVEEPMDAADAHRDVRADAAWNELPPSFVFILTDDQGYGDLAFHGNELIDTPVLDRLATQSTRFERFFVSPLCTPSRASLLTGRYYLRTGAASVTRGVETLRSEEVTIAEALRAAGYATGCFGKWHLGEHYPNHPNGQGFEEFFGMPTGHWDNYFDPTLERNGEPAPTPGFITDVLTDAAIAFIEKHRDRPFFCYVPYNAPHTPLQVPDAYFDKYKARGLDDRTAAIYGLVENVDENVGRLLAKLDELELADRTIVLFLSDNGAEGPEGSRYNAGMRGMKGSVHEGGVRVPLFVRWPGKIKPDTVVTEIAAHIDLLPTIVELCGLEMPKTQPLDGVSLVPLLFGRADDWPERMIFTRIAGWKRLVSYVDPVITDLQPFPGGVRTRRWRIVNEGAGWQLFDMVDDPGQTKDVAAENPGVVDRLGNAYEAWFADVTRVPIRRPPISVGYRARPAVELPAPEAYFTGGIQWYNQHGFAHDWLTGWTDAEDFVWWDVEVVRSGRYQVTLMVTCPPDAVGTRLRVEAPGSVTEAAIRKAYDPEPAQRPTRHPKKRFTQTFARLELGEIRLDVGRQRITLKAVSKPGERVCDLKSIWLRRVD